MPHPVDCHICDTRRTLRFRKCKGQGYLLGHPELTFSFLGEELVMCDVCFGLGIGPCPACGTPIMSDCRLWFKDEGDE